MMLLKINCYERCISRGVENKNIMCSHGITKTVILNRQRESGKTRVQVDECISDEIQMLNDKGVWTLGCCCGHGVESKTILIHESSLELAKSLGYSVEYYDNNVYNIFRAIDAENAEEDKNMFKFFKVNVPTGETKQLNGVETWVVSWYRRTGEFSGDVQKCYQAFTNEDDAKKLKKALEDAHKLIGNTSGTTVTIEKQKSGL